MIIEQVYEHGKTIVREQSGKIVAELAGRIDLIPLMTSLQGSFQAHGHLAFSTRDLEPSPAAAADPTQTPPPDEEPPLAKEETSDESEHAGNAAADERAADTAEDVKVDGTTEE